MISRHIKLILMIGIAIMLGAVACNGTSIEATSAIHTPTLSIATQTPSRATPYAQEPAAGICASFEGAIVTINLYPDIPDPRCSKVLAHQTLKVINQTQSKLQVSIGSFAFTLEPGASTTIDTPFGEYLAPGVHQLQVSPCCSAEVWLEED